MKPQGIAHTEGALYICGKLCETPIQRELQKAPRGFGGALWELQSISKQCRLFSSI